MKQPPQILVVEGRFYNDISDELLRGAEARLSELGATWNVITVPGALEIPQVLATASASGLFDEVGDEGRFYEGCVALGCVIRGETSHYDIVAGESARALLDLSVRKCIPLGNGILTVETHEQAMTRAAVSGKNKGRDAVNACIKLIEIARDFERTGALLAVETD